MFIKTDSSILFKEFQYTLNIFYDLAFLVKFYWNRWQLANERPLGWAGSGSQARATCDRARYQLSFSCRGEIVRLDNPSSIRVFSI